MSRQLEHGAALVDKTPLHDGEMAVEAHRLEKTYIGGDGGLLHVLKGVDLQVAPGETVAIIGASGAGKSTLLHLLGGLDQPSRGDVLVGGVDLGKLSEQQLAYQRNTCIGFVFQFHHLLREFTAEENVAMPLLIAGVDSRQAGERARELLDQVGLSGRLHHRPTQLSGGEQQRVAVARALVGRPLVLLADEPSGNLDNHSSEQLHQLFFRLREQHGIAMVIATHNQDLARRADQVMLLDDGLLKTADQA